MGRYGTFHDTVLYACPDAWLCRQTSPGIEIVSADLRSMSRFIRRLNPKRDAPASEAEEYISELCVTDGYIVNALRQRGRTLEASSWDEYWRRAGPILEQLTEK